jgi:hypothetical protein
MGLYVLYVVLQPVLQLLALLFRSTEFNELELVVLRHELAVLRRQISQPALQDGNRLFLAAGQSHIAARQVVVIRRHARDTEPISSGCGERARTENLPLRPRMTAVGIRGTLRRRCGMRVSCLTFDRVSLA